jgi:integrase
MAHIQHTIQRNGYYYFNYRLPTSKKLYRRSLKTDSYRYCKKIIGNIMKHIEVLKRMNILVDAVQLKDIVNTILTNEVSHIVRTAKAAIYPLSAEGKSLKKQYIAVTKGARHLNHNIQSSGHYLGQQIRINEIPSFKDYAASNLVRNVDDRSYFSKWDEDEDQYIIADEFMFVEHEPEYIEHEVDMSILRSQAINLKNFIIAGNNKEAKDSLELIIESFGSEQSKEARHKNGIPSPDITILDNKPKLSELVKPYIAQLTIKGVPEYKRHMEFFVYFLGERQVDKIGRKELDNVMGTFANMPLKQIDHKKGGVKTNIHKDYSLEERINLALEGKVEHRYLPATKYILSAIKVLRNFFLYLRKEDFIEIDPVSMMLFDAKKVSKNKGYKRTKFSKTLARKITNYCAKDTNNELHWAALIMAYTGSRNSEVMQLRREDILIDEEFNILYFRITDQAGSTKTESSNRIIPIHSKLIELGFNTFYQRIPSGKIFTKSVDNLNNWFKELRLELNIPALSPNNELLDLYSFRHTVRTTLTTNNQSEKMINAITGHSNKDIGGNYTHINIEDIQEIKNVIEHIIYDA